MKKTFTIIILILLLVVLIAPVAEARGKRRFLKKRIIPSVTSFIIPR